MRRAARGLRVVLDISPLDTFSVANGQYRYLVDLVRGLSQVSADSEFIVLGSRETPVPELRELFHVPHWQYCAVPPWAFRGATYLAHLRYSWLLRRVRPDVFHALHTFVPILAPCPVAVTIFDLMFERFVEYRPAVASRPYRLYRWGVRHVAKRAICISETTARDLGVLWSLQPPRAIVIPLGTDVNRWHRLAQEPAAASDLLDGSGPTLLSVYNLEPRKNLETLLHALAILRREFPNLRLVLFGRGAITEEREAAFQTTVRILDLGGSLVQCGTVADHELARLYAGATAFVFPSLYEGFGLPVLEAMACGGCVVARSASAMSEVVGNAGLLTNVEDTAVFARDLAALLRDQVRQSLFRMAARRRAEGFTVRRMAEATYGVYQSLAVPHRSQTREPA